MDNFVCICLCHIVLSVSCSHVVTYWEKADLSALLYVTFFFVFVTFPYGVLERVWNFIIPIPDLCLLPYFVLFACVDIKMLRRVHVLSAIQDQSRYRNYLFLNMIQLFSCICSISRSQYL